MIPNNLFHQIRKIFFPAINQNISVSFGSRRLNFPNNSLSDKSCNRINIKRVQRKNSFGFENSFPEEGEKLLLGEKPAKPPTFQLWRKAEKSLHGDCSSLPDTFQTEISSLPDTFQTVPEELPTPAPLINLFSFRFISREKFRRNPINLFRKLVIFDLVQKFRWRQTKLCLDFFQGKEIFTFNLENFDWIFFPDFKEFVSDLR